MSGDPARLLGATGVTDPLERELLLSVREVGPPSEAQDEAWRSLAAEIAVMTAAGAASSAAAAAGKASTGGLLGWASLAKVALVALGAGLGVGGGYWVLRVPEPPSAAAQRPLGGAPRATPLREPSASPMELPPPAGSSLGASRAAEGPIRKVESPRVDSLHAESALLMAARAQLRSGDAASAQASLDQLQARFPKGMLAQEREVLAIEVLAARGNSGGARQRARAFIQAFPKSPHSQKLARFVE